MQIQPSQNYSVLNNKSQPNFKAAYPVIHWVAETNGSYAPVVSLELTKKLQRTIVSLLNKSNKISETPFGKNLINYISKCDIDYRRNNIARSFYDKKGGWQGKFNPISYLLTGEDGKVFEEIYGKKIGKTLKNSPKVNGVGKSAEHESAKRDYAILGRNFVMDKNKRIFDAEGIEYALHTKFQTIRNRLGNIKGYELVDIKFCPQEGPNNPFVRVGLIK